MPQNFIDSRRDQRFLLPPDVRDWLAEDHLAWFVIDTVAELDLEAFYSAYRADGHGRAADDPSMMVTLLVYAYAVGQRSSRMIERHCRQDIAFRVVTANVVPDHATIARFVVRHERALADLFGQVLGLCDRTGLVAAGVIAIDGTRLAGNASKARNQSCERIAREILAEHVAADEAEDAQHGDTRGDELPEQLRSAEGRRAFLRAAKARLAERGSSDELDDLAHGQRREPTYHDGGGDGAEAGAAGGEQTGAGGVPPAGGPAPKYVFDTERIVARRQGREGWPREARRQLEASRWQHAGPVPRSRAHRLVIAGEYLEDELEAETVGQAAYEHYHATGRRSDGRRFGKQPRPYVAPEMPDGKVNLTDPDSRHIRSKDAFVQGSTRRRS